MFNLNLKVVELKNIVGIDISKGVIDVVLYSTQSHRQFCNSVKGFQELIPWIESRCSFTKRNILFCLEYTGIFSYQLSLFLSQKEFFFSIVSGLEVKRSLGITRGKNDKIDAKRITEYAYLRRETIKCSNIADKAILSYKN